MKGDGELRSLFMILDSLYIELLIDTSTVKCLTFGVFSEVFCIYKQLVCGGEHISVIIISIGLHCRL